MRTFAFLFALVASAQAFTHQALVTQKTTLFNSETHIDPQYTVSEGMTHDTVPVFIDNLNQENFLESLEMMEPLLMNECVGKEYDEFMSQLETKCADVGKKVPKGYAKTHP